MNVDEGQGRDYKETLKHARRKIGETYGSSFAVQKKSSDKQHEGGCRGNCIPKGFKKTTCGCIVESHESTRQRVESSQPENHEHHIAGKGFTSMSHYNLVHKFIPLPRAMKIPDAEAAVDQE